MLARRALLPWLRAWALSGLGELVFCSFFFLVFAAFVTIAFWLAAGGSETTNMAKALKQDDGDDAGVEEQHVGHEAAITVHSQDDAVSIAPSASTGPDSWHPRSLILGSFGRSGNIDAFYRMESPVLETEPQFTFGFSVLQQPPCAGGLQVHLKPILKKLPSKPVNVQANIESLSLSKRDNETSCSTDRRADEHPACQPCSCRTARHPARICWMRQQMRKQIGTSLSTELARKSLSSVISRRRPNRMCKDLWT